MDTLNYKCPNCSAGLTFDSKEQKMKCEFCGSTYSLEELDKLAEQQDTVEEDKTEKWKGFEPEQWQSDEKSNMAVWNCPSCGAEILAEKTTGSTVCPYCDNPMIMPEQFKDSYRPDYIIPFMKSKKEAKQALKAHYEGKPLLPKVFKDENHLEEIRAVYVPFWLFDLDTAGRFSYEATKTRVWEDDDYNYTATRFYHVARAGKINFRKIPVDGSKAIDDTMMEAIEPYEYQDLTEFNMSYLSGYMADKYDQEPDELTGRVYERMEQSVKDCFEASVKGYATVTPKQEKVYVPFWLFDLDTAGRFSYEATKTRVWEDDDYNYTATRFYHVARAGKINFRKIPVDGSKAIDDTMMEAIEPYEYQDLTEFNMSYLSGYMADKYDQEPDELTGRVYERMEQSVKDCFEASVKGYATVTPKQEKVTVTNKGEVKYGLFPVWFLNTKWNGKTYSFAMNGQTGRLIGDLPVGKDLAVKYWFKCHIPLTIAMTAIVTALRFMGVI